MPLLDHFHPPIDETHQWESFHSNWATRIADGLNDRWLSEEFLAEEFTSLERVEVDIATLTPSLPVNGLPTERSQTVATMPIVWTPPAAVACIPIVFPDMFEVRVFARRDGWTLVGAIELISPGNKDRPSERRAFATKCAAYLQAGVSVIIVDIVTNRRACLHNELLRLLNAEMTTAMDEGDLYAVSYRPVMRGEESAVDLWPVTFKVGEPLPTMPLRLTGDLFVPIELELSYAEACRRRRIH